MRRIYLSFAPEDEEFAGLLALALERAGIEVARLDRLPGDDTQTRAERIYAAMLRSDAIILLVSPGLMASDRLQREDLAFAREMRSRGLGGAVILVVREPVRLPEYLTDAPTIIAASRSPDDVARAIDAQLATDATGAGEERARGITLPASDQDERAPVSAVESPRWETPMWDMGSDEPSYQQPPAPSAPPVLDEPPIAAPTTGALPGGPAHARAQAGKEHVAETLHFSAYHANTLPVETWNTLLVYTAVDSALEAVAADAATFTEMGSAPRTSQGRAMRAVAHGAELTVEPHMEGVTFSPPSETLIWRGGWHRSLFRILAGAELANTERPGWVDIYAGPMVPIARIDLAFAFTASRPAFAVHRPAGRTVTSNPHDTVFISYSHRDREAFTQACDEYTRFGIKVYTDEHLEAGADYERELGWMIAAARVFHLLWSPTSARSSECRNEWTAALQREPSERFIKPWFWKQPLAVPPPEFVQHHISFRYQRLRRRLLRPQTWL